MTLPTSLPRPKARLARRSFLRQSGLVIAAGSMVPVIASRASAQTLASGPVTGYGPLVPDPEGVLDLPAGFRYRVFSREGDALTGGGLVPASHDGMAAFSASIFGTALVRNHELNLGSIEEDGLTPVQHVPGHDYDPAAVGGTTTLLLSRNNKLVSQKVSLSGTLDNCAGGPTPWGTWLTCEETFETLEKRHGYIFEVDPWRGGNPEPIVAMGRFEHEAVAFARDGSAYLTEDASEPFGCIYRYEPNRRLGGRGSLHAGGKLRAMALEGVSVDLSEVQEPGTVLRVRWVDVPNIDPADDATPTREQAIGKGATPIRKAEGAWRGQDGSIWFTASYADGPDAEDAEDVSAAAHSGQVWRYDPRAQTMALVTLFPYGSPFDGPDNITVSPHGFALVCTDGDDDNWLVGISERGESFAFAKNASTDDEFTGATFSPDGRTLFVNIQGAPALTFAITGPWHKGALRG
jgi:secreted PhoX family phosphatase